MHHARVARVKLDTPHVGPLGHRKTDGEDAEGVGRLRLQREGLGRLDDQVWLAEQPAGRQLRHGRQRRRIALGCPVRGPGRKTRDLRVSEWILADEVADAGFDLPRRHEAALRDRRDLRGTATYFVVGGETERRRAALPMTRHTRLEDDRRNVPGKRHLLRGRVRRTREMKHQQRQDKDSDSHLIRSGRKQPTACVSRTATGWPCRTASRARSSVRSVG